jgi:hypothetical protein
VATSFHDFRAPWILLEVEHFADVCARSSVAVFDPGTPIHTLCTTMHDRFLC